MTPDRGRPLSGRVVLVAGVARQLAASEARLFAAAGASVVVGGPQNSHGERLVDELRHSGADATYAKLDTAAESDWREIARMTADAHGRLDVLVINPADPDRRGVFVAGDERGLRVVDIDQWAPIIGLTACAPLMGRHGGGLAVTVSRAVDLNGYDAAWHAASWCSLLSAARAAALEAACHGTRVAVVTECSRAGDRDTDETAREVLRLVVEGVPRPAGGRPGPDSA